MLHAARLKLPVTAQPPLLSNIQPEEEPSHGTSSPGPPVFSTAGYLHHDRALWALRAVPFPTQAGTGTSRTFFSLIPADFEFQVVTAGISKAPLGEVAPHWHLTSEGQCHWQWPARSPVSASERRRGWKCPPSQLRGGGAGAASGTGTVTHFGGRATKHGALVIRVGPGAAT
jgi:hypothetical protein